MPSSSSSKSHFEWWLCFLPWPSYLWAWIWDRCPATFDLPQSFLLDNPKIKISCHELSPTTLHSSLVIYGHSPHPNVPPHVFTISAPGLHSRIAPLLILGNLNRHVRDFSNTLLLSALISSPPFLLFCILSLPCFIHFHSLSSVPCISLYSNQSFFSDHRFFSVP